MRLVGSTIGTEELGYDFKKCEWTGDGTSLVTSCSDHALRLFVVPPTLLDETLTELGPYTRTSFPAPVLSYAVYPQFDLDTVDTCVAAVSHRASPVKLYNVLVPAQPKSLLSLPLLVNDELMPAYDMKFSRDSSLLVCGSKNYIAQFDLNTSGLRNSAKLGGIVSAVDTTADQLIAIGTFHGRVVIYTQDFDVVMETLLSEPISQVQCSSNWLYATTKHAVYTLDIKTGLKQVARVEKEPTQRSFGSVASDGYYHGSGSNLRCDDKVILSCRSVVTSVSVHPKYPIYAATVGSRYGEHASLDVYT